MALSPGGCTLATGGGYKDKCVRLWRPRRHHQEAGREGGEAWRCVAVLKVRESAVWEGGASERTTFWNERAEWTSERPVPRAPGRTCLCACGVGAASLNLKAR